MRYLLKFIPAILVMGFAYLSTELSRKYVLLWTITEDSDDLVAYATWQTLSYVFIVVSVILLIWAWISTRNDD